MPIMAADEEDMNMDFFTDDSSDDDSSDDDFSDDDLEASVMEELLVILLALKATEKLFRWNEERLDWDAYVRKLNHRKEFQKTFRLEETSFNLLSTLLRPSITDDMMRARASGAEPIYPEATGNGYWITWLATKGQRDKGVTMSGNGDARVADIRLFAAGRILGWSREYK